MSQTHGSQDHHHLTVGRFPRNLFDFNNFFGEFVLHDSISFHCDCVTLFLPRSITWFIRSIRWSRFSFASNAKCSSVCIEYFPEWMPNMFSFRWLQDPPRLQRELCPVTGHKKRPHSDKFRITLDVTGYKPEDLSVKVVGRKLFIDGKQELRDGSTQMRHFQMRIESFFFFFS